jgi:hypothetical protein
VKLLKKAAVASRKKPGDPVAIISYDENPTIPGDCNDGT